MYNPGVAQGRWAPSLFRGCFGHCPNLLRMICAVGSSPDTVPKEAPPQGLMFVFRMNTSILITLKKTHIIQFTLLITNTQMCALAWQNARSDRVCLDFSLLLSLYQDKESKQRSRTAPTCYIDECKNAGSFTITLLQPVCVTPGCSGPLGPSTGTDICFSNEHFDIHSFK